MTKQQLVNSIHGHFGLTKRDIMVVVDAMFQEMKATLLTGEDVKLSGFGNFVVSKRGARVGRILATGEKKPIPSRYVLAFKPSAKLKQELND